ERPRRQGECGSRRGGARQCEHEAEPAEGLPQPGRRPDREDDLGRRRRAAEEPLVAALGRSFAPSSAHTGRSKALAILIGRCMPTETEQPIAGDGVWTTGPDGELIPDYESTFPTINEGEVVHGQVVRVDKDEVLVDIGYKSEGVIPVAELSIRRSVNPADEVSIGDEIDALVMTKEDAEGRLILSKKRARFEM